MRRFALPLLTLSLLAGCAHAPARREVVWPEPPETPRIHFLTAFKQNEDLDQSFMTRMSRVLFGGGNDPALVQPMGVAVSPDGRRLYIADFALGHVLKADFDARTLKLFAPDEAMGKPFNVALDAQENVYVSDSVGRVIRVFSRSGEPLRMFGAKELERPTGIAVDPQRKLLYVSDSAHRKSQLHRVRVFSLEGQWLRDLGPKPGQPSKGDSQGQWYFPTYITLDAKGDVYVADTMNFRIQVFDPEGNFLRMYGENGDGPGAFARLKGLAFDGLGNLYVVDGGHSNVQLFNRDFQVLMFFGGYARKLEYFDIPSGIAIDPKTNRIYVCNEFVARINVYELINTRPEDSKTPPAKTASASAR